MLIWNLNYHWPCPFFADSALNANAIVNVASEVENVILETVNDAANVDTANNAKILSQGASNTIDNNAHDLVGETANNIGTTAGNHLLFWECIVTHN